MTIELLEIIRNLKHRNASVLFASHMLERAQSVCDRVAPFNKGSIVLIGTVAELAGGSWAAASTSKWRRKDRASPSGWLTSLA